VRDGRAQVVGDEGQRPQSISAEPTNPIRIEITPNALCLARCRCSRHMMPTVAERTGVASEGRRAVIPLRARRRRPIFAEAARLTEKAPGARTVSIRHPWPQLPCERIARNAGKAVAYETDGRDTEMLHRCGPLD
jgi:hypothetical protein